MARFKKILAFDKNIIATVMTKAEVSALVKSYPDYDPSVVYPPYITNPYPIVREPMAAIEAYFKSSCNGLKHFLTSKVDHGCKKIIIEIVPLVEGA